MTKSVPLIRGEKILYFLYSANKPEDKPMRKLILAAVCLVPFAAHACPTTESQWISTIHHGAGPVESWEADTARDFAARCQRALAEEQKRASEHAKTLKDPGYMAIQNRRMEQCNARADLFYVNDALNTRRELLLQCLNSRY